MAALEIRKRSDANGFGIPMNCEGGCVNIHRGPEHHNSAIRVAYIAGYPAMGLCTSCSRRLQRLWDEADGSYREWEKAAA